ncbi:MAG TPA: sigma-70 family RNA polymerase sigma factor [Blastocatellia bacterium]|nr:sigma-70 family RNA polymerase sigma factor [Blastocatellia bacterium]
MPSVPGEVTQLLIKWGKGDQAAFDELIPIVYAELKRLARRYMNKEHLGHTLQTSALINEAYLRLADSRPVQWQDRKHFYAVAAQIMRHILIDHARSYRYEKRGAGAEKLPLEEATGVYLYRAEELLALDEALKELEAFDPRKSRITELRFFGGLTVEETAEVLGLASVTVMREWRAAKAWLHQALTGKALRPADLDRRRDR